MALAHLTWALVIIPVPRGMLVRGGIRAHVTTATTAMPVPATTAVLAISTAVLVPTMADGVIRITAIHPGRTRPMGTTLFILRGLSLFILWGSLERLFLLPARVWLRHCNGCSGPAPLG